MIVYYEMRFQKPYQITINDFEEALELARERFYSGASCCQTIIDEDKKIIYSLDDENHKSPDFQYELNGEYSVYDTEFFQLTKDEMILVQSNFKGIK